MDLVSLALLRSSERNDALHFVLRFLNSNRVSLTIQKSPMIRMKFRVNLSF